MRSYLNFEKSIAEIEEKIEELSALGISSEADAMGVELTRLKVKAERQLKELYSKLDPGQKTQVARHPERPRIGDYIAALVTDFVELAGDRSYGEDAALLGGLGKFMGRPCLVMGQEKGRTTQERLRHNFGMVRPEGYRKAVRLMDLAERFRLPVVTFVDTPGADPGIGAEERGQGEAIARSTERCLSLSVPMVPVIVGEGASGGAVAIAAGDYVIMLEHAIYTVISPEGAASILWKDAAKAKDMATTMKITAQDLLEFKVIEEIVAEPVGGAHRHPEMAIAAGGAAAAAALDALTPLSPEELRKRRRARYYAIGRREAEVGAKSGRPKGVLASGA
ncbi:MAG: acetyl-CoA carboxylase carboxyltransferase subunit alpha, partial [Hyphomonadaceae bacterium]